MDTIIAWQGYTILAPFLVQRAWKKEEEEEEEEEGEEEGEETIIFYTN